MKKRESKQARANRWYRENQGNIIWDKAARDEFRLTDFWKKFVSRCKKKTCEFCSCKTSHPTLHHLYPDCYDLLEPEYFKTLCYQCHTKISQLSRRKDRSTVPEYFLPFLEQSGDPRKKTN